MPESVSRELILPAIRLDVPPRPSEQQLRALAERSSDVWCANPREWAAQQVSRLAVAAVLQARLAQAGGGRADRPGVGTEPEQVTLAQLVALFRPHVGLAGQAFQLAVVEAVNGGVPAATDPVREGLRLVGVTGRDPLRMLALGLEKVPARARTDFWSNVRGATTLTAVVDALAGSWHGTDQPRPRDVSGLDRSQLTRADALVLGGGRTTPVVIGPRRQEGGRSWLQVPVAVQRRGRAAAEERGPRAGERTVEVTLRADGWVEVFETALDAVGAAMQQIDLGKIDRGNRPRTARLIGISEAIAGRLATAKDRTVANVCASLRAVDPFALELFDHQVTTTPVPVAVPVIDDDHFVQLWLPTSALAGPLFTGAPDLFLGGGSDVRLPGRPPVKSSGRQPGRQPGAPAKKASGRGRGRRPRLDRSNGPDSSPERSDG